MERDPRPRTRGTRRCSEHTSTRVLLVVKARARRCWRMLFICVLLELRNVDFLYGGRQSFEIVHLQIDGFKVPRSLLWSFTIYTRGRASRTSTYVNITNRIIEGDDLRLRLRASKLHFFHEKGPQQSRRTRHPAPSTTPSSALSRDAFQGRAAARLRAIGRVEVAGDVNATRENRADCGREEHNEAAEKQGPVGGNHDPHPFRALRERETREKMCGPRRKAHRGRIFLCVSRRSFLALLRNIIPYIDIVKVDPSSTRHRDSVEFFSNYERTTTPGEEGKGQSCSGTETEDEHGPSRASSCDCSAGGNLAGKQGTARVPDTRTCKSGSLVLVLVLDLEKDEVEGNKIREERQLSLSSVC